MSEVERRWKRGEVHPKTGMVFRQYKNQGKRECWITHAQYFEHLKQDRIKAKTYRSAHPEKKAASNRISHALHREQRIVKMRNYRKTHRHSINANCRKKNKALRESDPLFLLRGRIRCRLHHALTQRNYRKNSKTSEYIGCSWSFFRSYIEARFQPGMTWENRHLWHIDHVVPLASAKTHRDMKRLAHYSNLFPRWSAENLSKGAKEETQQTLPL